MNILASANTPGVVRFVTKQVVYRINNNRSHFNTITNLGMYRILAPAGPALFGKSSSGQIFWPDLAAFGAVVLYVNNIQ